MCSAKGNCLWSKVRGSCNCINRQASISKCDTQKPAIWIYPSAVCGPWFERILPSGFEILKIRYIKQHSLERNIQESIAGSISAITIQSWVALFSVMISTVFTRVLKAFLMKFKLRSERWVGLRQRKRKSVLNRGKLMCLKPWQGGGKDQGTGHKESAGQDGRREWGKRKLSLVKLSKVAFPALKESVN